MRLNGTKFSWLVLSAFAAAVTLPSSVFADGVPAAQFEVAAAGGTTILTAGTVSGTAFNGGTEGGSSMSTASASYSGGSASASGSGSTSGGVSTADSSGLGLVTFYFSVAGSAPGVTFVPLLFSGSVSTSATGPDAVGEAYFETPGGQINACSATGLAIGACGSLPASNSGTLSYNASPGDLYDIGVIASGSSSLGTGSWSASVDPMVEINPTFVYASDFTLVFSPDLPGTSVPEPSSSLLLGAGLFALIGAGLYRKLTL